MKNAKASTHYLPSKKISYFAAYTAVFVLCTVLVFGYFFVKRKTFIYGGDAYNQHLPAFLYWGDYLRAVATRLFREGRLVLPQYDFGIGFGGDIYTTLNYYVIGDPLCLLAVFAKGKSAYALYSALVIVRLYLAGIAFSLFCFYKGNSRSAVLTGSIIYTFTAYVMVFGIKHPFFINPMIYFPLVLLGVEKILGGKRPYLFIVMVFISAVSNFYFFYMIVLLTVLYVLVRIIPLGFKECVKKLFAIGACAVLGVMMSAAILFPVLYAMLGDGRGNESYPKELLYGWDYYQSLLSSFITTNTRIDAQCYLGLSAVALIPLALLWMSRGRAQLKTMFVLSGVMLLLPICGQVLNGMAYITNRWVWGFAMLVAYIAVTMWEEFLHISRRKAGIIAFLLIEYAFVLLFLKNDEAGASVETAQLAVGLAMAALAAAYVLPRLMGKRLLTNAVLLLLVIATVAGNAYFRYVPSQTNAAQKYFTVEELESKIQDNQSCCVKKDVKEDGGFYRFAGGRIDYNYSLVNGMKGTAFYWSLQNPKVAQFNEEMCMPLHYYYRYTGMDHRAVLHALMGVRYFYGDSGRVIPYGYHQTGAHLYESDNCLPLGYTYDSYMTRTEYEALNAVEKQEAMLQSVVLEDGAKSVEKGEITLSSKKLPYELTTDKKVYREGNKLYVAAPNASVTLHLHAPERSETYLSLRLEDYSTLAQSDFDAAKIEGYPRKKALPDAEKKELSIGVTSDGDNGTEDTTLYAISKYNLRYFGSSAYVVNTGYSSRAKKEIKLTFRQAGVYTLSDLEVISLPMAEMETITAKRKEDVLKNISVKNDVVTGEITLNKDKILCLSIPYSEGWTAYVDGEKTEIQQANTMLSALALPKGTHHIKLVYTTPLLKESVAVTAAGFLAFAVSIAVYEKRRKRIRA